MLIDINIKKNKFIKTKTYIHRTTIQTDKHINNHNQNNKKLQQKRKKINQTYIYTFQIITIDF